MNVRNDGGDAGAAVGAALAIRHRLFASISVSIIASQVREIAPAVRDRAGFDSLAEKEDLERSSTLLEIGRL